MILLLNASPCAALAQVNVTTSRLARSIEPTRESHASGDLVGRENHAKAAQFLGPAQ
ncbi:MAG: hypothetical protein ACJ8F3_11130 [Xanthobacteraceae bacterium]